MSTTAPLDRLTGTLDALPFTIDTVGDKVAWTAVALDHMDGWGALDDWDYGTLDALALEVKVADGSASIAVTATSEASTKLKGISAAVDVSVAASGTAERIRPMVASVEAISTASSAFARVRPFEALVDAVGSATSDLNRIRPMAATAEITVSATSSSNFVTLGAGTAEIAITQATGVVAEFAGAGASRVAVTGDVTMTILGEEWSAVTPTTPGWVDAAAGAAGIWIPAASGATGNWLSQ